MYGRDIKVGMRVTPVIKTIDGPLSNSKQWAEAQEKGQDFLYVVKVIDAPGKKLVFMCGLSKAGAAERFNALDLRAYPWKGWKCRTTPGYTLKGGKKAAKPKAKKAAKPKAKKAAKPAPKPITAPPVASLIS